MPSDFHVLSTPAAVIAGLTYDALPFMALPIYVALENIDRSHIEAAADLCASRRDQFLRVVLPLSAPGVYAGILLVAITNIGDYVSAAILGGPSTTMIGNIIQTQYVQNANYPISVGARADPDGGAAARDVPLHAGLRHPQAPGVRVSGGGHRRPGGERVGWPAAACAASSCRATSSR